MQTVQGVCDMEEMISKNVALEALHNIGGCGAQKNSWDDGWDSAIDTAYDVVRNIKDDTMENAVKGTIEWLKQPRR